MRCGHDDQDENSTVEVALFLATGNTPTPLQQYLELPRTTNFEMSMLLPFSPSFSFFTPLMDEKRMNLIQTYLSEWFGDAICDDVALRMILTQHHT